MQYCPPQIVHIYAHYPQSTSAQVHSPKVLKCNTVPHKLFTLCTICNNALLGAIFYLISFYKWHRLCSKPCLYFNFNWSPPVLSFYKRHSCTGYAAIAGYAANLVCASTTVLLQSHYSVITLHIRTGLLQSHYSHTC